MATEYRLQWGRVVRGHRHIPGKNCPKYPLPARKWKRTWLSLIYPEERKCPLRILVGLPELVKSISLLTILLSWELGMMFAQPDKQKLFKPATLREMMTPKDMTPDGVTVWGSPFEMVFKEHVLIRTKGGLIDSYQEGSCSCVTLIIIPEYALGANILVSTFYFGCSVGYKGSVLLNNGVVTALNETDPVRATTLVPLPCNRHPTLENLR